MELRTATADDIRAVSEHSASRSRVRELPADIDHVFAVSHEGQLLGVGGLKIIAPGTAWAWMDWTPEAHRHVKTAIRTVRDWLGELVDAFMLQRVMAAVEVDFEQAIRTVEHLGFVRECRMERFFGDHAAYLYAIVR